MLVRSPQWHDPVDLRWRRQSGQSEWSSTCDDILARMVTEQIDDLDTKIACLTTSRAALTQFLRETYAST